MLLKKIIAAVASLFILLILSSCSNFKNDCQYDYSTTHHEISSFFDESYTTVIPVAASNGKSVTVIMTPRRVTKFSIVLDNGEQYTVSTKVTNQDYALVERCGNEVNINILEKTMKRGVKE